MKLESIDDWILLFVLSLLLAAIVTIYAVKTNLKSLLVILAFYALSWVFALFIAPILIPNINPQSSFDYELLYIAFFQLYFTPSILLAASLLSVAIFNREHAIRLIFLVLFFMAIAMPIAVIYPIASKYNQKQQQELASDENSKAAIHLSNEKFNDFCAKQVINLPIIIHKQVYLKQQKDIEILVRYGHATFRSHSNLGHLGYNNSLNAHHYPEIKCIETSRDVGDKTFYSPSVYCPNYRRDAKDEVTTPRSRYHFIIGEDDKNNVVQEKISYQPYYKDYPNQTIPYNISLHRMRIWDTQTKQLLAEGPFVTEYLIGGPQKITACNDNANTMMTMLERTFVHPNHRYVYKKADTMH